MKKEVFEITVGEDGLLIGKEIGEEIRNRIGKKLSELEYNTVLEIDFGAIRHVDASCANVIIVNILRRLESGEYPDRFIILSNVGDQHREDIEYPLKVAGKAVVVKEDDGWSVLGVLINSYREALDKVMELGSVTARELQKAMGYNKVNEASTKLSYMYQKSLIAREPSGGRRFRYFSLIQEDKGKV